MAILTLLIRVFVQWPRKRDLIFDNKKNCTAEREVYQVEIIPVQTCVAIEDLLLFIRLTRNEMLMGL